MEAVAVAHNLSQAQIYRATRGKGGATWAKQQIDRLRLVPERDYLAEVVPLEGKGNGARLPEWAATSDRHRRRLITSAGLFTGLPARWPAFSTYWPGKRTSYRR